MRKENIKLFTGILLVILLMGLVAADYMRSDPRYVNIGLGGGDQKDFSCNDGTDFVLQISPFGCTPGIVRSDLLAEQNVPVFCQIGATKINPLIKVEAIDSISFSGEYSKDVQGVGFHPAQAALGTKNNLNNPILNNIGYAVVVLKQQKNISALPDFVEGTLTANIKYDIENAFGIGKTSLVLKEFTDEEWENEKFRHGFWNGESYLRVSGIDENSATVIIEDDVREITKVNLDVGERSKKLNLPGYQCQAGLELKLDRLVNPDTRVRLSVDGDTLELAKGDRFLENKCRVRSVERAGLTQTVKINCKEDEGSQNYVLILNPIVDMKIDGVELLEVSVGDKVFNNGAKSVYVAYMGSKGNSERIEDVFIYFTELDVDKPKLSNDEIVSLTRFFKQMEYEGYTGNPLSDFLANSAKGVGNLLEGAFRSIKGENIERLDYGAGIFEVFSGNKIYDLRAEIIKFGGVKDIELGGDKDNFEKAIKDFDAVITGFPGASYPAGDETILAERALANKIEFLLKMRQGKKLVESCLDFKERYPNSEFSKIVEGICDNKYRISNTALAGIGVLINGQVKSINLERVTEPEFKEFGVEVLIKGPNGKTRSVPFRHNQIVYLDEFRTGGSEEFIQLVDISEDSAKFRLHLDSEGFGEAARKALTSDKYSLEKGVTQSVGGGYVMTLSTINLNKLALVSVIPKIDNVGTTGNFSFRISIEKPAFELTPEETKRRIKNLNETVAEWEKKSERVGRAVKGLKTACLATSAGLVTKNFLSGTFGGGTQAIARKDVVRNVWNPWCESRIGDGKKYRSMDECLADKADDIESSIQDFTKVIEEENARRKGVIEYSETGFLEEDIAIIETVEKYVDGIEGEIRAMLDFAELQLGEGDKLDLSDGGAIDKGFDTLDVESARDLRVGLEAWRNIDDPIVKESMRKRIYNNLLTIQRTSEGAATLDGFGKSTGLGTSHTTILSTNEDFREISVSNPLTLREMGALGWSDFPPGGAPIPSVDSTFVRAIKDKSKPGEDYFVFFDADGRVIDSYKIMDVGNKNVEWAKETNPLNVGFKIFKGESYINPYSNAKLKYYENEPYKGRPAIVPFNLKEGWYVSITQTFGGIGSSATQRSYDDSGAIRSYWLCNVGANKVEQNKGGDDICELINIGVGQPRNQFPGLDEIQAGKLVRCAEQAIEQASRAYKPGLKGEVRIKSSCGTVRVDVGDPAVDIPSIQCQELMPVKDCQILFNVCDPVICPSSRCDFGGTFPVRDVIQSGIVGSSLLCLPNFSPDYTKGNVIPICLTGIHAGIDGWTSILTSHRDCLVENLETGQLTGICDEMYSLYSCEFFWRQAIPLSKVAIPKLFEFVAKENTRGGGEYLGVRQAFDNAQESFNFFTNFYGANAYNSFKLRTAEDLVSVGCKGFVSAKYPDGGSLADALTAPDSPPQYHGRFDEILFTSATVPPVSQYKVFYHIFAGKDNGAHYQVYLKGAPEVSYFQEVGITRVVDSGYIGIGETASQTKDFTAPSGYKELCISVNGQEECGFKQASTSFAVDYIEDKYLEEQAKEQVTTEKQCIAGSASIYSVLNPSAQGGGEELLNPAIYNRGLVRICASESPGKGSDELWDTKGARWKGVGTCGQSNIKCWLDSNSVRDVIQSTKIEASVLEESNKLHQNVLSGTYFSELQVEGGISDILVQEDDRERIRLINTLLGKVFLPYHKAYLILLRGGAYGELANNESPKIETIEAKIEAPEEEVESEEAVVKSVGLTISGEAGDVLILNVESSGCAEVKYELRSSNELFSTRGGIAGFFGFDGKMDDGVLVSDSKTFRGVTEGKYYVNAWCFKNGYIVGGKVQSNIVEVELRPLTVGP